MKKDYESKFEKCCGKKPQIEIWNIQPDGCGANFEHYMGISISCPICGAELTMRKAADSEDELEDVIEAALKEWNVGKKTVIPWSWEYNYKAKKGK